MCIGMCTLYSFWLINGRIESKQKINVLSMSCNEWITKFLLKMLKSYIRLYIKTSNWLKKKQQSLYYGKSKFM